MADSTPREPSHMSLRELRLRPGMFLQIQPEGGLVRGEAQFCAAIAGRGIMVVPLGADAQPMSPGTRYSVHGFTGLYDFSFTSAVIQLFTYPFAYTLLGYPDEVQARKVRNALRMKTQLAAVAVLPKTQATEPVTLVDLSAAGAMISSPQSLGAIGDPANLSFAMEFEGKPVDLALSSSICHSTKSDDGDGYRTGLAFKNVSRNDRLALQYFTLRSAEEQTFS